MHLEEAKLTAEKQNNPQKFGARLHLRLPDWKPGWSAAPFGYQGAAKPIMGLFENGNFYGYVFADQVELASSAWELVKVVETGSNTDARPNPASDLTAPPHKASSADQ